MAGKRHVSHHGIGSADSGCSVASNDSGKSLTRRAFLGGMAALGGSAAIGGSSLLAQTAASLPNPDTSGIKHIVVAMMENRSFDHLLGWLPNANGKQAGLTYQDRNAVLHSTHHLLDFQGCSHPDPDHSYTGGRIEFGGGKCDGWLRAGSNDGFCLGYYAQTDLAFLGKAAPLWTTCSGYFAAIMAETYPNRIYQHAAQTDRLDNSTSISGLPTIWDRLHAAGVSARYYYSDVPLLALWGSKYSNISSSIADFYSAASGGSLPAVSFVDPRFLGEAQGTSNDDHPHADIRNGEAFLSTVYSAITNGPGWSGTVLVINFDEWGGFFEHVPPTTAAIPPATAAAGDKDGRRGFRVPCIVISPWSRRSHVDSGLYDHCSVLKMIEWRHHLTPLTIRDKQAVNLARVLDFTSPNLQAPQWFVPQGPFGKSCSSTQTSTAEQIAWLRLANLAASTGWRVY